MKASEKFRLLKQIESKLHSTMDLTEIVIFLNHFGVNCDYYRLNHNGVTELLGYADENLLIRIADDLEIVHNFSSVVLKEATVWKVGQFKLFLSHLASFKAQTAKLQQSLSKYAISSFVAHEDIEPSKEWQIEIEAALHSMDAMAVLLMPGFKESNWCDQEVGVAVGRDVLIIPVRKGLDPYGFIGKYQGIQAVNKSVAEVAKEIFEVIIKSPKTRGKIIGSLANTISQSTHDEDSTEKVLLLQSINDIPKDILESMKTTIAENNVLINSKHFIDELNKLFNTYSIDKLSVGGVAVQLELDDDIPF